MPLLCPNSSEGNGAHTHTHNCEYQELRVCSFPPLAGENIKSGKAHVLAWQGTLGTQANSTLNIYTPARCI